MRIDPKLRILSFLVVGAFLLSIFSVSQALSATTSARHASFKTAQTKAHRILANKSRTNNTGISPAQQYNMPANPPTVCYRAFPPGWSAPAYTWLTPAQPYNGPAGQTNVASGGWKTPAGQGATAPQQKVAARQAPPATSGWGGHSLCYWLPSWATRNWWNTPATSGRPAAAPTYNQPARPPVPQPQPVRLGANPNTFCYSGWVPNRGGTGYTPATYCARACY
jgi:hypothetical protein